MNRFVYPRTMLFFTVVGCQHSASAPPSAVLSTTPPRLVRAEQLIIPPDMSGWPRQLSNGEFPHYPPVPRNSGVEARVVTSFVIEQSGRPEPRTISILQSPGAHPEFVRSVCAFLRNGAEFSWGPQAPARTLVVVPFEFTLQAALVTEPLPPEPNLSALRDSIRRLSPGELATWIESKPHCFS